MDDVVDHESRVVINTRFGPVSAVPLAVPSSAPSEEVVVESFATIAPTASVNYMEMTSGFPTFSPCPPPSCSDAADGVGNATVQNGGGTYNRFDVGMDVRHKYCGGTVPAFKAYESFLHFSFSSQAFEGMSISSASLSLQKSSVLRSFVLRFALYDWDGYPSNWLDRSELASLTPLLEVDTDDIPDPPSAYSLEFPVSAVTPTTRLVAWSSSHEEGICPPVNIDPWGSIIYDGYMITLFSPQLVVTLVPPQLNVLQQKTTVVDSSSAAVSVCRRLLGA